MQHVGSYSFPMNGFKIHPAKIAHAQEIHGLAAVQLIVVKFPQYPQPQIYSPPPADQLPENPRPSGPVAGDAIRRGGI